MDKLPWKLLKGILMNDKYYIFGASGHAKVVLELATASNIKIEAVVDDLPKSKMLLGFPVVQTNNFQPSETSNFIIAIGDNTIRKKIATSKKYNFFKAIHPSATVAKSVTIDQGTVIMPQAVINAAAKIGSHCIINSASVVEHDCKIGDYVHISPKAALAGNVSVGEGTHIGIGACVIQGIKIGKWATIGAGAVIIANVPDYAVVVGNPGKIIKHNI